MAKFDGFQNLKREDFNDKDQSLIDKLAFVINPILTQLESAFNKNIDFDNLKQEIKEITLTVNNSSPIVQTQFRNNLLTRIRGIQVIKAENLTNVGTYATSQPFVSFTENNKIVTINNVSGLQNNNQYKLTVITYG